jgi:hypothetical protein
MRLASAPQKESNIKLIIDTRNAVSFFFQLLEIVVDMFTNS